MMTNMRSWRRITPEMIADLPQTGAVFEVANLVRTVQFIGTASGNLRTRLATYAQEDLKLRPIPGGYYVRYETAAVEDEALSARLDAYRDAHSGTLPTGNAEPITTLRLAARRAA